MRLRELVAPLVADDGIRTMPDVAIQEVTALSKQVRPGSLFIAVRGTVTDGHQFVEEAIGRGAAAIVGEFPDEQLWRLMHLRHPSVPLVRVRDARAAMAEVGRRFYHDPATKLQLVGITGTNGKTTTSYVTDHLLRASGAEVGLIGTVAYRYGARSIPAWNTTPGQLELQALFAQMLQHRAQWCVMEVSSHALAQQRVDGLQFSRAVFTNLGSDHLDYHGSREAYFTAKSRLFEQLAPGGRAIINVDDPYGRELAGRLAGRAEAAPHLMTYGLQEPATLRAVVRETTWQGTVFEVRSPAGLIEMSTTLLGAHNILNILAAMGCVLDDPCDLETIASGVAVLPGVPGRLELVRATLTAGETTDDVHVVIDYAHTEAALEAVLLTVRSLQPRRILTVFGCGGNRDRTKRPAMGRAAGRLSDVVYVTSDNPRDEDPAHIAAEVAAGLAGAAAPHRIILDRREAIVAALEEAGPGDCVLIAGKGHEQYQILKDSTVPFDDRQVAAQWLRDRVRGAA